MSQSFYRMSYRRPALRLACDLGRLSGFFAAQFASNIGFDGSDFNCRVSNDLTAGFLLAALVLNAYLRFREDRMEIVAVRYEDFVDEPIATCRRILEFCRLPVELADKAARAASSDSQEGADVARAVIGDLPVAQLTQDDRALFKTLMGKIGLHIAAVDDLLLEGTVCVDRRRVTACP